MSVTVLGVFDSWQHASQFKQKLVAMGITESSISTTPRTDQHATTTHLGEEDKGFWGNLKELFTGEDEHEAGYYAEATRRGGVMVRVEAPENRAAEVTQLMKQHNAVDVHGRAQAWKSQGWKGYDQTAKPLAAAELRTAREADQKLQIVEEKLAVGKREVASGGVRVLRRVTERPVEEQVTLRKEHVDVQRRAVDRPLTGAEANAAFTDKTIELTETSEEAVVSKTAHVVGEVEINRDVQQTTETVRDTVRKTDVQVEKVPAAATNTTTTTTKTVVPGSKQS
ncbi:MAG TPA: YsnF/AvaK domain-containing protein [Tepidisphaeraceae bacterium]|jgi:uncharacterized protein (TIGR02271 family)